MRNCFFLACLLLSTLLPLSSLKAAETERQYLSGKGKDDALPWEFMCSTGQNSGQWRTIPVPSNWELQGYGIYTYGTERRNPWPKVTGNYKRTFTIPANWVDKSVFIVFEGVMTDTQVKINGQSAGPMHQGGYYRFRYDITPALKPAGAENLLEVTVDDESANASVNNAERRGDYWNFAGIFRPVYLEALPRPMAIEQMAIAARADGSIAVGVSSRMTGGLRADERAPELQMRVLDLEGKPLGTLAESGGMHFEGKIAAPRLWTAETPNLYQLEARFVQGATEIHTVRQKFGFRTLEVRRGDSPNPGLFLNGQRIMLKGADRHSFYPDSGRCLSEKISRDDIQLMKDMNMNAVRMSHYPPDQHFLDACDELGLYVLDELAGWHQKYDTPTGHRLVEEMVTRDVNHPSILFWDNANEGGWNTDLDDDFAKWDPQKRPVLHPWESFRGIDTKHYPVYSLLKQKAAGTDLFFPTEMLHGLYDGGAGAGLADYWDVLRESKVAAGGFIWALVDESVKRTDQGGRLDSKGNQAPDGILGPYREKEGSFYAIKELWSPIVVTPPAKQGDPFKVENRYSFIDAKDCTFLFETPDVRVRARLETSLPPGTMGTLKLPPQFTKGYSDRLTLTIKDPADRDLWFYAWPPTNLSKSVNALLKSGDWEVIVSKETAQNTTFTLGELVFQFSKTSGQLTSITRAGKPFSLTNGPRLVSGIPSPEPPARGNRTNTQPAATAPAPKLTSLKSAMVGSDMIVTADYTGDLHNITYRIHLNGWITIDFTYESTGPRDYLGLAFDYPEAKVQSMQFFGNGPSRVWKNRLAGGMLRSFYDRPINDTITGDPAETQTEPFSYPEFKGIYAGVRWLRLQTTEGPITLLVDQNDSESTPLNTPWDDHRNLYVQVLKPRLPSPQNIMRTAVALPDAGLAFLHAIPPIGNKFDYPSVLGPQSQRTITQGEYRGIVSLYFGPLPR